MERKLYPGIPFSPQTTITNNIGAVDTIIEVSDISVFPEAPNLATIGTDEKGETILYTAKTEDALSGCQRGVEGTAKVWKAGEIIGRNFTAKDHNDLIDSMREIDEARGKPGGVAALDEKGKVPVEQLPDDFTPNNVATLGKDGKLEESQRPNYAIEQVEGLTEALEGKQNKFTGTPGQLIGIGDDGVVKATVYPCNPNLLDNWYFIGGGSQQGSGKFPINQRREVKYTGAVYGIDRWHGRNKESIITVKGDCINVQNTYNGMRGILQQYIDNSELLSSKVVTFSVLFKNNVDYIRIELQNSGSILGNIETADSFGLISYTATLPGDVSNLLCIIALGVNGSADIIAAKLELGDTQTLVHKEGDTWVLNDPPPNYQQELAKCERYQSVISLMSSGSVMFGIGYLYTGGATIWIPMSVPIRNTPTVSLQGSVHLVNKQTWANGIKINSSNKITVSGYGKDAIQIDITGINYESYAQPGDLIFIAFTRTLDEEGSRLIIDANM